MHDPFPFACPPLLARLTAPVATALNLSTLPAHIHEILLATISYHLICTYISPFFSARLFPTIYPRLPARSRLNWDVHVVSLVQSLFINAVALWVMWVDEERRGMGWQGRVWGYTGGGGMIQGFAAGYFLWDLGICAAHIGVFGWGLLAHAVAALVVFSLGFRPFVNFYGPSFILYELSSPFLNFHWFCDKLNLTGSRAQWYNGILLLSSFFCCRLLWGTYQSIRVYQDVWAGLHHDPLITSSSSFRGASDLYSSSSSSPGNSTTEATTFAHQASVPVWLAATYLGSNIVLNTLNFYWFGKMIETIRKRFRGSNKQDGHGHGDLKMAKPVIAVGGDGGGKGMEIGDETERIEVRKEGGRDVVVLGKKEVRRRKG